MWWVEFVYLTDADDQCPWSPSGGWRWRDTAWSARRHSHGKHINKSERIKEVVCFICSPVNNKKEVINYIPFRTCIAFFGSWKHWSLTARFCINTQWHDLIKQHIWNHIHRFRLPIIRRLSLAAQRAREPRTFNPEQFAPSFGTAPQKKKKRLK